MRTPIARAALLALSGLPSFVFAQSTPANQGAVSAPVSASVPAAAQAASGAVTASRAADTRNAQLDPIVVTATRAPVKLADAIPQTTVFTREDIEHSSAVDLAGLLALAPGAQVSGTGPTGSTASLFLRGASSSESLVLIDGVRVDSVSLGSMQLGQMMLNQIDRVEIVNGNVSSLYGSGAIGGVVQIFTRDGGDHPPRFWFSTSYGSYHTQEQSAGVSGRLDADGDTTFSVSLARYKSDGFPAQNVALEPNINPAPNGYLNEDVAATIKHKFNDKWEAGATFFQTNGRDSYDNAFGLPTDQNLMYSKVQTASVYVLGHPTAWWTTRFTASSGNDRQQSWLNGAYTNRFNTDNRQYTWQNDFALGAHQKLQAGYEHLDQSLDSDAFSAPERHVDSAWLGYDGRWGRNQFQANVRHDQYSDFGGANSYYLGYGFDLTPHVKFTASYSDAFRAPSFDDLYYPDAGNPSIRPERAHTVEAAVQYASDTLGVARLTAFQTYYTDLIQYVPDLSDYFYTAQNVGRAKVQGLEASWRGRIGKTEMRASATLQNPVDMVADQDLYLRARRFASFSANRSFDGVRVGAEWLVSGARLDSTGNTLGGYGIVNLTARYNITKSWYVGARVNNLFDKNYALAYGYNTPRLSGFLTVGWQQQ